MTKCQFNIKISKDLLIQVKRQAMMSGKSLTEHITDLVSKSLAENDYQAVNVNSNSDLNNIKERLLVVESLLSNREYLRPLSRPFNDKEAENCTLFMRGVFEKNTKKKNFTNDQESFEDFLSHINQYSEFDEYGLRRLKEIMLNEKATPWSGKELNELTNNIKCNCPIRKGLISWTGNYNCPSQQEICDRGEKLVDIF